MDPKLKERLNAWHKAIGDVEDAELFYLTLEANEKPLFSKLYLSAEGRGVADREAAAYSNTDWIDFKKGLAVAQTRFNRLRRELELKIAAYNATYLGVKQEHQAVKQYPGSED